MMDWKIEGQSDYDAGREYAKQECGWLAGMADEPKMAAVKNPTAFEQGYHRYLDEPDEPRQSASNN